MASVVLGVLVTVLLIALGLKLVGWLIGCIFAVILGTIKLLFIAACLASLVYFAVHLLAIF
jgi:hypothetical protein